MQKDNFAQSFVQRVGSRLKFPQLFAFTATLFFLDLVIPDLIPFIDEILLGLATLLLGTMRRPTEQPLAQKPPEKDITPPGSDTSDG